MSRNIIDNRKIQWFDEEVSRLSYRMIFDGNGSDKDEEEPDVQELQADREELQEERDRYWGKRLKSAREEAYQLGLREGMEQGLEEGRAEISRKTGRLEEILKKALEEWQSRQKLLEPGLLDLAFEMAEAILRIPVDNPEIRSGMERELGTLLQKADRSSRPVIHASREDAQFLEEFTGRVAPELPVIIRADEACNPGEFSFETDRERVIRSFTVNLEEFRESLTLPKWKPN